MNNVSSSALKFTFKTHIKGAFKPVEVTFDLDGGTALPQRVAFLTGAPATGKSTFLRNLNYTLSMRNVSGPNLDKGSFPDGPFELDHVWVRPIGFKLSLSDSLYLITSRTPDEEAQVPRKKMFRAAITKVLGVGMARRVMGKNINWDDLSGGQRQVVWFFAEVIKRIQPGSLILWDESEASMHVALQEPLFAALQDILTAFNAFAIIVTNSSYLVRQVVSSSVFYFSRMDKSLCFVKNPYFQAYGESTEVIAEYAMGLGRERDESWQQGLEGLLKAKGYDDTQEYFKPSLGMGASMHLTLMKRKAEGDV